MTVFSTLQMTLAGIFSMIETAIEQETKMKK
jgi:hypothetical protein